MDIGFLHGIATVAAFLAFAGVCWWAYTPVNRERFEQIGRSALDTDPVLAAQAGRSPQENGK